MYYLYHKVKFQIVFNSDIYETLYYNMQGVQQVIINRLWFVLLKNLLFKAMYKCKMGRTNRAKNLFARNVLTGMYKEQTTPGMLYSVQLSVGRVVSFGEGKAGEKGHILAALRGCLRF